MEENPMVTIYGVFYRKEGDGKWNILTSSGRGKSPYYGEEATARSVATWMANNGRYGFNKHNGYEFTALKLEGEWEPIG